MAARKLWSTTRGPEASWTVEMYRKRHKSRVAAYRRASQERRLGYQPGDFVDVWVDERGGSGWELHRRINLADDALEE